MSMRFSRDAPQYGRQTLVGVWLLLACACSRDPALFPAKGKVLYKNNPAEGAQVVFHPIDAEKAGKQLPSAIVQADGSFQLTTNAFGDGAAPGDYHVAIVWFAKDAKVTANAEIENRLPARYANPKTSKLNATIEAKATELAPFQLTD